MLGAIRKRDVLAHPLVTVQCFGWKVFFRALTARGNATFLSIVADSQPTAKTSEQLPELVGRCVELERCAMRIYEAFAERFVDEPEVRGFFRSLACQENGHAELLQLCHSSVGHGRWVEQQLGSTRSVVEQLECEMLSTEGKISGIDSVEEALRVVIAVESSEINEVFMRVVEACPSQFVRVIGRFWDAEQRHMEFICQKIPELAPGLADECAGLQ